MHKIKLLSALIFVCLSSACASFGSVPPSPATQPPPTLTETLPPALPPTSTTEPSLTPTFTPIPTDTPTPTSTFTPIDPPTIGPTATPVKLMGSVLEHSNCRYGPGAMFLYKYGLLPTSYMEIIGRDQAGTWLLIHSRQGEDFCWLKASLMEVKADVMLVPEVDPDIILPWTRYYPNPLTGVSATRNGSDVTVSWDQLVTKAGDEIKVEDKQTMYLIEAWVCKDGKITFTVVGSNTLAAKITDEPGCSEPSHGRVYGADKHGYTPWMTIPWPK